MSVGAIDNLCERHVIFLTEAPAIFVAEHFIDFHGKAVLPSSVLYPALDLESLLAERIVQR